MLASVAEPGGAMPYDLRPIPAPRAAGAKLKLFVALAENPLTGGAVAKKFFDDIGINDIRRLLCDDAPTPFPPVFGERPEAGEPTLAFTLEQPQAFPLETAADFTNAYLSGATTPSLVAERVIAWTIASDDLRPPMRVFIRQHAEDLMGLAQASTERYRQGCPLGPLDGVPIAIKDELDQRGYPTTVGTSFLGTRAQSEDAEVVARLRAAGAILIGKTNMHEMGTGVTGLNPHHQAARNPYAPEHSAGGSSTGSAAAVAGGFCPIAIGADGGGSIRIPAGLCGVVGLKSTFGRVSEHGAAPICWSLAHVGPIAASVRDLALAYGIIAGPDPKDPMSQRQPAPTLAALTASDLKGVRLGVFTPWFEDAEPDVVSACRTTLEGLRAAGAEVVTITIPELFVLRCAHLVTFVSELAAATMRHWSAHRKDFGYDIRMALALSKYLTSADYVHAQRLRTRVCRHFDEVLQKVDAIVTPATACTAPVLEEDAFETGDSNMTVTEQLLRYALAANFTGLPAISFPAGYDRGGLPVGMQVMGRAWREDQLLRIAAVAEGFVQRRRPQVHRSLLK